jgi:hypothetical protein
VVQWVTVEGRDDGTNRRARLGVTYAAGSGPATVFVKAVDPDPRDATGPLTPEQAADGVRGLARMHGTFWNQRVRRPELDRLEPFVPWDGMQDAPLPAALEHLGDDAPASVHALGIDELIERVWKPYVRTLLTSSVTLLHGDAHIGDTYLTPDGGVDLV